MWFIGVVLAGFTKLNAQLNINTFNDLDSLLNNEDRLTVVFIHTDWCKFCHQMESTTFTNDSISHILNEDFYFVKLNAEQKEDIIYQENTFKFVPNGSLGGIHQMATLLGEIDGSISCLLYTSDAADD